VTDIKNPKTQLEFLDTSKSNSTHIGGGNNTTRALIGDEFADIGGPFLQFDSHLEDILSAILTSNGLTDIPGLQGVELVSMDVGSFTIGLNGNGGSTDYLSFSGTHAENAIAAVAGDGLDIKNKKSQVAIFDTDTETSVFIGGGKNNAKSEVGTEFADVTGGTRVNLDEVGDLFAGIATGKGWNGDHGMDGVELRSVTDDGFMLTWEAAGPTRDSMIFSGQIAVDATEAADNGNIDIKDSKSQFAIFDFDVMDQIFIGGGKSNARDIVGEEFGKITGGTWITEAEAMELFDALTSGKSWNPDDHGLEGVEIVGVNETSFALSFDTAGPTTDTILFTNVDYGELIA